LISQSRGLGDVYKRQMDGHGLVLAICDLRDCSVTFWHL
jgi:hypothetical protein